MINVVDRVPTYPNRIKVTKSDGTSEYVTWERADEPTVPGTPINKALFDSIVEDIGLNAHKTVYVSTAGSDTLGDGTAANPYATITKAINSLPKNLNGFNAMISIAAGTYNEDVLVARTFGGEIVLSGATNENVSIRSLRVSYGSAVTVQNIALTLTGSYDNIAIAVMSAELICTSKVVVNSSSEYGIYINFGGYVVMSDLTVTNTTNAALNATNHSSLYAGTISGNASAGIFFRSVNGSLLSYNVSTAEAPTKFLAVSGGRIYSGAQTSIPNY